MDFGGLCIVQRGDRLQDDCTDLVRNFNDREVRKDEETNKWIYVDTDEVIEDEDVEDDIEYVNFFDFEDMKVYDEHDPLESLSVVPEDQ
jgi:hypothetical protein